MATAATARRARRPVAVLVGVFLALGGAATATGMALGAVGGGPAIVQHVDGHPHGPDRGLGPGGR